MTQCSVESCESNLNSDLLNKVTLFNFPQWEDARFHKWVKALGRPLEYFKQDEKFICSRHFRLEDFKQNCTNADVKSRLSLLDNAVPSLYLSEDNKNMRLPPCDINTSGDFIIDVNCIKTEKINAESEEGFIKTKTESTSINSTSRIPNKNLFFKEEPQENAFELIIEENTLGECSQLTNSENQPGLQENQSSSNNLVNKKFKCVDCNEIFGWSTELKKHKRLTHGTFVCNICLKHVVKLSNLKTHKKTKHNISYVFTCENCDEAFFENRQLLKHMKTHNAKLSTEKCKKCRKKFQTDVEFTTHECIIGKKLFQCEVCRKCFAGETNLNTHKNKYHIKNKKNNDKEQDKNYECDVCEKVFKKRGILLRHKRMHEKPYQCDTCKKSFAERFHLKVHQLNHAAVECIHLGRIKY